MAEPTVFQVAMEAEMSAAYADLVRDMQQAIPWLGPLPPVKRTRRQRVLTRLRWYWLKNRVGEVWTVARHGADYYSDY